MQWISLEEDFDERTTVVQETTSSVVYL